jgi:hypothetical protein
VRDLLARVEPQDLTPEFSTEFARLADLKGIFEGTPDTFFASYRGSAEAFATHVDALLHAERSRPRTDLCAVPKLESLQLGSRALVFVARDSLDDAGREWLVGILCRRVPDRTLPH